MCVYIYNIPLPLSSSSLCQSTFLIFFFFRKLVTVLIAVMTALDQHTDGVLTNEFATTMMGFMMEELDGNVF